MRGQGRPGPVLIDLPKDVMSELGSPEYPETVNLRGYKPNTSVHMGQLKRALKMLNKAKRPLFLAGGGVNIARANKEFTEVVEYNKRSCSDDDHGTRRGSDRSSAVYRKPGNARGVCREYGSERMRSVVFYRYSF